MVFFFGKDLCFWYNFNYSRWEFKVLAQKKNKVLYNMVVARHIMASKMVQNGVCE
jgi:hypothetical protein